MLTFWWLIFAGTLGLIIGSFLNVVIYRYNTGKTILGRSFCFACRVTLRWTELVPVFSYLIRRGRCRACFSFISPQYPLVEFITALIFAGLAYRYNPFIEGWWPTIFLLILYWVVASVLMVIAVYDLRHKIIPDDFSYAFIGLAFLAPFFIYAGQLLGILVRLANGLLGAGVLFLVFWGLWRYSEGRWMGFGDAKLVIGIGLLLGLLEGVTAVILAFWLGAIVGLGLILLDRSKLTKKFPHLSLKSEIPFAPFLVLATIIALIWDLNFLPF